MRDGLDDSDSPPHAPASIRSCWRPRPTSTRWTRRPPTAVPWRETGPVEWYVSQGYAYVHADVRGSGHSEGEFEFMGPNEQNDDLS